MNQHQTTAILASKCLCLPDSIQIDHWVSQKTNTFAGLWNKKHAADILDLPLVSRQKDSLLSDRLITDDEIDLGQTYRYSKLKCYSISQRLT